VFGHPVRTFSCPRRGANVAHASLKKGLREVSSYESLYRLRGYLAARRQRRHAKALRGLHAELKSVDHPYTLGRDQFKLLMRRSSFRGGSRGYLARPQSHEYIYRLCGVKQLAIGKDIRWDAHVVADQPDPELFRLVKDDFEAEGDWIPLSRYAQGFVNGFRRLTFWTTYPLHEGDIIANAHTIGLTNNWLRRWSVILRCQTEDLTRENGLRVPTVIDAFTEMIFHPTRDQRRPKFGKTIKLGSTRPCVVGTEEYVLGPLEVEKISLRPIHIRNNSAPCVHSKSPALWDMLEEYYDALP
jgi:hypothetical protein